MNKKAAIEMEKAIALIIAIAALVLIYIIFKSHLEDVLKSFLDLMKAMFK